MQKLAFTTLVMVIYNIWAERNKRIFKGKKTKSVHQSRIAENEIICQVIRTRGRGHYNEEIALWGVELNDCG